MATEPDIPERVQSEAGELVADLRQAEWFVVGSHYAAKIMGNWYIDLARRGIRLRLIKDRSQYMVDGPSKEELERNGLWRALDDFEEFRRAVVNWVGSRPS